MKAIFIPETGGPEVLTYGDRPEPEIGAGDLLVRVRAAALNRRDLFAREGSHGVKPPLPHIPGLEVAGEVVEAGPETTGFKAGDRVLGTLSGRRLRRARADGSGGRLHLPGMDAVRGGRVHRRALRHRVAYAGAPGGAEVRRGPAGDGRRQRHRQRRHPARQAPRRAGDHHRKLAVEARQGRGAGRRRGHQLQGIPRVQSKGQGAHRRRGRARDLRARGRAGVARVLRQPPAGRPLHQLRSHSRPPRGASSWASSGLAS